MVVRPLGLGRRLSDLPDVGRLRWRSREQFVVVDDHTFRVDYHPQGQAADVQPRRRRAVHHQFRTREEERDRGGPVGAGLAARTTRPAAAPTRSRAGSPAARRSWRASTTGRAARCRKSGASSRATSPRPARAARCWSAATPISRAALPPKDFDQIIKEGKVKVRACRSRTRCGTSR